MALLQNGKPDVKQNAVQKVKICTVVGVCLGFLFLISVLDNPFHKLNVAYAKSDYIHCLIEYTPYELNEQERKELLTACESLKMDWIPTTQNFDVPTSKNRKYYIDLVLTKQWFLHIFIYEDESLMAVVHPWESHYNYMVKNPDCLQGFISHILEASGYL